ncbi:MerR family transcriptional regulator [Loigolactobacillus coryniformis]|uniref:MerR family transcriptional regulator n=1 Tax=Loigolactobacillus coryniformis TaxID=1610 RepID=UPI00233FC91C|nr:MerR family transcriptional regulator [Loigolactobacillus coryniformis]MDC4185769.1 MerR family transcriptional regulator [Loigolactobacillus coryniformis]
MNERQISIGEAAKISGLTVRTLQHYDNIGLLPVSGRTQGGRRYYTEEKLIKLQHIIFYKNLGLPLKEIQQILQRETLNNKHAARLLEQQKLILYNQIASFQNSIVAIEISQEITSFGRKPPWNLLTVFMNSMNNVDLSSWKNFEFTAEQLKVFNQFLPTVDDVIEFYNTWKRLSIKAAAYQEVQIPFDSTLAQKLKEEWLKMVATVTGGQAENETAYLEVDHQRDLWNPAEQELIKKA